jgi:hypothetical protein
VVPEQFAADEKAGQNKEQVDATEAEVKQRMAVGEQGAGLTWQQRHQNVVSDDEQDRETPKPVEDRDTT